MTPGGRKERVCKDRLVRAVSASSGVPIYRCAEFFDAYVETAVEALLRGERVHVAGVGSLEALPVVPRWIRDPNSGEEMLINRKRRIRFRVSSKPSV